MGRSWSLDWAWSGSDVGGFWLWFFGSFNEWRKQLWGRGSCWRLKSLTWIQEVTEQKVYALSAKTTHFTVKFKIPDQFMAGNSKKPAITPTSNLIAHLKALPPPRPKLLGQLTSPPHLPPVFPRESKKRWDKLNHSSCLGCYKSRDKSRLKLFSSRFVWNLFWKPKVKRHHKLGGNRVARAARSHYENRDVAELIKFLLEDLLQKSFDSKKWRWKTQILSREKSA